MIRSFQDFLLGVAATDRELLDELEGGNPDGQIHRKRAGLGGVILLTFLATWASTAWMATTFDAGVSVSIASGLLAGLLKLVWDRQVVAGSSTGTVWVRVFFGVLVSVVMATPLVLFMFGDFAVDASKQEERYSITSTYDENLDERKTLEAGIDSLRRGQNFFQTMVETEEGGLTQKEAGLTDEQLKRYDVEAPSGKQGCGPRCEAYQRRAQGYESALGAKQQQLSALPTREDLKTRRDSALAALEQETKGAVTRLIKLYQNKLSESWFSLGLFLVLVFIYAFVDLLPVTESLLATDLYAKEQRAQNKEEERIRQILRAKKQGEQRKMRVLAWLEAQYYKLLLEKANSGDISPERVVELADKADEFEAREDSTSRDSAEEFFGEEQWPTDEAEDAPRSEGMAGRSPDRQPSVSAGDGAPLEKESDGHDAPRPDASRENGCLLLPPANGQEGG